MAVLVGLVMIASSAASASSTVAPFKGTPEHYTYELKNGCGSLSNPIKAKISLKTGLATFKAAADSRNCKAPLGQVFYSADVIEGSANAIIPIKVGGGTHSVSVVMDAKFSSTGSLSAGSSAACPWTQYNYSLNATNASQYIVEGFGECYAFAEMEVLGLPELYDATNATWCPGSWCSLGGTYIDNFTYAENLTLIDWFCYSPALGGACYNYNTTYASSTTSWSMTTSVSGTAYLNGTFVAGHHYYLVWQTAGYVETEVYLMPGASAKATLDMGSTGNGVLLKAIVVH